MSYIKERRAAYRPLECNEAPGCWVDIGGKKQLTRAAQGTPRCLACGGALKTPSPQQTLVLATEEAPS
jgi:hypothetical protein